MLHPVRENNTSVQNVNSFFSFLNVSLDFIASTFFFFLFLNLDPRLLSKCAQRAQRLLRAVTFFKPPVGQQSTTRWFQSGHPGGCRARCVYPDRASQFLHRNASRRMRRRVDKERERVFMRGTTQLATVETNTRRTAIRASSTLISFPRRVRAVAFSSPSNWTTCCCCCWSSILEILV